MMITMMMMPMMMITMMMITMMITMMMMMMVTICHMMAPEGMIMAMPLVSIIGRERKGEEEQSMF